MNQGLHGARLAERIAEARCGVAQQRQRALPHSVRELARRTRLAYFPIFLLSQ